jgi:YjbE family integral membrane protein
LWSGRHREPVGREKWEVALGSIAQYLNLALWGDGSATFWIGVPQIVLSNVLLSGDTAVVIAMACRGLPPRQRSLGMAIGAGTAAVLLVVFAVVIAPLLAFPYVKLIGGLALIYIAIKRLMTEAPKHDGVGEATHLGGVVRTVVLADIVLGLDNIIAVAAVARGNLALLAVGLAVSIPIILAGAAVIVALLDRFPLLVWAGAALLGWIAGDIVATDPFVQRYLIAAFGEGLARRRWWRPAPACCWSLQLAASCGGAKTRRSDRDFVNASSPRPRLCRDVRSLASACATYSSHACAVFFRLVLNRNRILALRPVPSWQCLDDVSGDTIVWNFPKIWLVA